MVRQPGAFAAEPAIAFGVTQQSCDRLAAIVFVGMLRSRVRYAPWIELVIWAL